MYIKVMIWIGGGGIAPPEMAAPVGIHYKGRPTQPSREKLGRILGGTFQVLANFSGSYFGI